MIFLAIIIYVLAMIICTIICFLIEYKQDKKSAKLKNEFYIWKKEFKEQINSFKEFNELMSEWHTKLEQNN